MKKLLMVLVLHCLIGTTFAQKNFNPIHFTKITTTNPANQSKIEGDIHINTKDSVIVINENPAKKLLISVIAPEQTAVTGNNILVMWVAFLCTTADNKSCTVTVVRQKETGKKDLMVVKVDYDNDGKVSTSYDCDYLKDLY
ncbi:hypothetical protein [Mucilaginibacter xinganensis]|uniref:Uncharacterized protein n=1 Tax=Mucilaginibacter xinganensis TaxID=1234841 RepID=A0A223NWA5_9SPHI|nr:hypothetical protein [Mucilaginibacter xinganensis]ASU34153.1 hypothetical protein MuYL_2264 [Mucilaginibacter xinganensis]